MSKINNIYKQLKQIIKYGEIKENEPLKDYTSFKIGGPAKFVILPKTLEEFIKLVLFLQKNKINYYVLGNGTNILVSDLGYDGVIIKTTNYNEITRNNDVLEVNAGAGLQDVCVFAQNNSLQGLEEAAGIPGTVGGAVLMNAGAFLYTTENVVLGVLAIVDSKIRYYLNDECEFEYRNSIFSSIPNCIILRVDFILKPSNKEELLAKRNEILKLRASKQPLNLPSAGSIFKKVDGYVISKIIDEEGLKGLNVNDAMVSKKHAGFIINNGNATAKDVITLINQIKQIIKNNRNIVLIEEIKYLGNFNY